MADPLLIEIPTELRGPRLKLRAYGPADAAAIEEALEESRPELAAVFVWGSRSISREERTAGLVRGAACWLLRTELAFGIWSLDGSDYFGDIGIFHPDWQIRSFEIGYWLRTSAVGNGYATEAARILTSFAFGHLQARRVYIQCDALNTKSSGVPRRLGFEREGTLRNYGLRPDGQLFDMAVFGLTPERWERELPPE